MKWKKILLNDCDGVSHEWTGAERKDMYFHVEYCSILDGYACYVSAGLDVGFHGDESLVLQADIPDTGKYLAINNHSSYWCSPFWGKSLCDLPSRVQQLLIYDGEKYCCYLPVCDGTFKTLIRGGANGCEFMIYSNCRGLTVCDRQLAFVYMEGTEPLELVRSISKAVAELLKNGLQLRAEKVYPELFEYLGWCSWDALHIHVNHEGLVKKAREFQEKKAPVHYGIIDDMWAEASDLNDIPLDMDADSMIRIMHGSTMHDFRGDPVRFPEGMNGAIRDMKEAGIPNVGVWFPTTGYWGGFTPDGAEAKKQRENTIVSARGIRIVAPEEKKASRLFDDFCGRVKSWGGDFVKIDNQGFHANFKDIKPIGQSARAIQKAIDAAADKYFNGALINCMGMPSECMFNRTSSVSRCSDDFQPESREWFSKNILQCSYNGLLQGQYYINDWDMWWTDDEQAVKNSLCRAVSGGPIYISDRIGCTRPEILKPLCLENGQLLRCDESATPTWDCLLQDPTRSGKIFKIRNRVGANGVIAAFNIDASNRPVGGSVSPEDAGLEPGSYAWYEYFTGEGGILTEGGELNVRLENCDAFRLYTFAPHHDGQVTPMGRLDLFIGIKTVQSADGQTICVAEGGKIGFISQDPISVYAADGKMDVKRSGVLTVAEVPREVTQISLYRTE